MTNMKNIKAQAHQEGQEIPAGWTRYQAEGQIKVDDVTVTRSLNLTASNIFEASKFCTLIAESEGSLVCAFKIRKSNR